MSPACQGLIFVICLAASRQGGGESLPDDGEMAGRMRPSRDHITPNTAHTAQGDSHSPTAPLSWTQRLKRVFRIRVRSRVKAGCSRGSGPRRPRCRSGPPLASGA